MMEVELFGTFKVPVPRSFFTLGVRVGTLGLSPHTIYI
jgi:hypothetical protein